MSKYIDELKIRQYCQPPAGNTEKHISLKPISVSGGLISSYNFLKDYYIHDFGQGLKAAETILRHILQNKLRRSFQGKDGFWSKILVLKLECEFRSALNGSFFDELKPGSVEDIHKDFAAKEGPDRIKDIYDYTKKLSNKEKVECPLYVSGAVLNFLGAEIDPKMIFMMDGARRLTAAAMAHKHKINIYLLILEDEFPRLLKEAHLKKLTDQIKQLQWFDSYQTIPLVGIEGQRSLRRFELMDMSKLSGYAVMDFGCNLGQICIQAVQAGANEVFGIEGMSDTYQVACDIGSTLGFNNLNFLNVNFNNSHFDRDIDSCYPDQVDYSFFLSVYRTKELTQRDRLFYYIINKTKKGIFFEGHAHSKIDTPDYYKWLFDCFKLKYKFLGYSEGNLRPLFFLPVDSHSIFSGSSSPITHHINKDKNNDSEENKYLVSAIVSTYKAEKFIEGRIRNLLNQTLNDQLEIIIVDSNSPEDERSIVEQYTAINKNIKYLRSDTRESIYRAWNRGIKEARGKYITNANTDDRLRPDALEILVEALEKNPEIGLAYGDFLITNFENMEFYDHICCGYSIKPDYSGHIMLAGCHMGPQPMWRRSVHNEIGYFDENLESAGDYELWCRLATRYPMKHISKFLGLYYNNPSGIVNRNTSKSTLETKLILDQYRDKFPPPDKQTPSGYFFNEKIKKHKYVNICIITFNRLNFTKQAIESLLKNTRYPHVITVVDNNSQDGTKEYLEKVKQEGIIKNLVLLDENVGVAKASNLAWKLEPNSKYYLKFDNDIVIQKPDWLSSMVSVIDGIPQLGAIAYNFEPHSYPLTTLNGHSCRIKRHSNLGGACILIPRRTRDQLGYWCEDYGLYGEEDADYGERIRLKGLLNAYMEDENIGTHLPGGKAAHIDLKSLAARDGTEEVIHHEYRQWKDDIRRKILANGQFEDKVNGYRNGHQSLYIESTFADPYLAKHKLESSYETAASENELKNANPSNPIQNAPAVKTSIVIVTYNSAADIQKCVESISSHTALPYELIIIDNCSVDGTRDYLKTLKQAKIILNSQNLGFSKGCNQGIEAAKGKYIVLLNPDTIVTRDWDARLISHFQAGVGAVGPVSNYVAGKQKYEFYLQERLTKLEDIQNLSQKLYLQNKGKGLETKLLIGFCMMIKREAIDDVGMLDEVLFLGNDDLDFSLRLQNKGYRLLVATDTFIYHKGQASFASEPEEKTSALVQASTDALYRKLENQYGNGKIPTSEELWDMGWFEPSQTVQAANKLTSIVILTHNQIEYTRKCLASVFKHTPESYELIIVDNGSTDGTIEYLESAVRNQTSDIRVRILRNNNNLGFAAGNNQGMAAAQGDYILLLNNDVVVTNGWLDRLISCAEKDPAIGLVGPRSNYVAGPQRVAEVSYDLNSLTGLNQFAEEFIRQNKGQSQNQWRIVGFCMLIKRQVVEKIGGLDVRYGPGNFEDDDFCIRAKLAGFKAQIAEDCFVHHFGGKTFSGAKMDYQASLNKNWEIFKQKWGIAPHTPVGPTYRVSLPKEGFDPARHYCALFVKDLSPGLEKKTSSYCPEANDFANKKFPELSSSIHANPFHTKNTNQGGIHVENYEKMYQGIQPLLNSSNPEDAIAALKNMVDAFPDFAQAHNDLGVLYYRAGDKQTALWHYEQAVQLEPGNITFKKNLADFYYVEQNRVEDALELYVDVLAIQPEDIETLLITGHICVALQRFDDAEVFYNRVLEIEPWHADAREILEKLQNIGQAPTQAAAVAKTAEEMYQQAQSLMAGNDPKAVIETLEDLLRTFPDFALAHNDLGVLYYNTGEKEKALTHYERAAELETSNITFMKNLADFYYVEQSRVDDALKLYVDVLALQPEDVETLLITGHICVALHKFDDAKVFYNRVLEIEPWNADARQNIETLESKQKAV
jgi:GT2 family glycosyltransferase/Flp pilus assembly protein TadD